MADLTNRSPKFAPEGSSKFSPSGALGFFGRRIGKPLSPLQAADHAAILPRYGLDLGVSAPASLATLFPASVNRFQLEIGFGSGEHLIAAAGREHATGFIGVEPFINGMARVCGALVQTPQDNLRLYDNDAVLLLDWLPAQSLDGIDLFYPDPWPKKRHWKRRFVSPENLRRFARVLKPGAMFRFASDIPDYVAWTLEKCAADAAFLAPAEPAESWSTPYPHWPGSRYEAKALREGRTPAYLAFERR
jgi:tRNA (guanine-N7-)-methyltransferase